MIAEEEKNIRRDPLAAGSDILKNVFGSAREAPLLAFCETSGPPLVEARN